jgi:hypothetical protein
MYRVRPWAVLVLMIFVLAPTTLAAQMAAPAHFESWRPARLSPLARTRMPDSATPTANGSGMILGGIAGVAVGYVAGGLLGSLVACSDTPSDDGDCELGAFVIGGSIASTFTIPFGVHEGNHGRGQFSRDLLISAALGAVGLGLAAATDNATVFLATPIAQIIASIWMEARTMPGRPPTDASH